jgi:hypothetical protein
MIDIVSEVMVNNFFISIIVYKYSRIFFYVKVRIGLTLQNTDFGSNYFKASVEYF